MFKYYLSLLFGITGLTQPIMASTFAQQNELSTAQMSYQNLLKTQANGQAKLLQLKAKLKSAEKKLEAAQLEVNKLRAEMMLREEMQSTINEKLKEAGERVNKAWEAANGIGQ